MLYRFIEFYQPLIWALAFTFPSCFTCPNNKQPFELLLGPVPLSMAVLIFFDGRFGPDNS